METLRHRERRWGVVGIAVYVAVLAGLFCVTIVVETPAPEAVILVEFGSGENEEVAEDSEEAAEKQSEPQEVASVAEQEAPKEERRPDPRALFPGVGNSAANEATSSGVKDGEGAVAVAGRDLAEQLPMPAYNAEAEGRVVIRIVVNAAGEVTRADYQQAGSTTNDGRLVEAARSAARRAKFTPGEGEQAGTITYVFKIRE